jgi:hypothetical protein
MNFKMTDRDGNTIFEGPEWNGTESPRQPKTPERKAMPVAPRGMNAFEYGELLNARPKRVPDNTTVAAGRSPWATRGGVR